MCIAFPTNRLPVAVIVPVLRPGPCEAVFALELKGGFIWHCTRNRTARRGRRGTFDFMADSRGRGVNTTRNPNTFKGIFLPYVHEEARYPGKMLEKWKLESFCLVGFLHKGIHKIPEFADNPCAAPWR